MKGDEDNFLVENVFIKLSTLSMKIYFHIFVFCDTFTGIAAFICSVVNIGGYPAARIREFHLQTENVVHCVGPDVQKLLFYFIHPANSNSHENLGILVRFQCFLSDF